MKERDLEVAKFITATHWPTDPRPEYERGPSLEERIARAICDAREEGREIERIIRGGEGQ